MRLAALLAVLLGLSPVHGEPVQGEPAASAHQEAPLLTVFPRQEQVRQLEVRADLHMVRKEYPEAIETYGQALRLAPRNAVLLNKMGIAQQLILRFGDAKKFYERAARADARYAAVVNNLGTLYYAQRNYKRAIRYYKRALALDPNMAATHSNLGAAFFARKQYDEALQEFLLALRLDPEIFVQRSLYGTLLQDTNVEDRARFFFLLAKSYAAIGHVENCLRFLRRALEDGFPAAEAQSEPGFAALRDDERFQALFRQPPPALPR